MTANVSIISAHRDDVLKLANSALRFRMPDETPAPRRADRAAGGRPSGGNPSGRGERRSDRSVYVLQGSASAPTKVTIKTGISDGVTTEILEGLKEGDRVVIGMIENDSDSSTPAVNPFGGGRRRP